PPEQAPPAIDDSWDWSESIDDELPEPQPLIPDLPPPPSQFTDDAWDWDQTFETEDQVDEPILRADIAFLVGGPRFIVKRDRARVFTVARDRGRQFMVSAVSD